MNQLGRCRWWTSFQFTLKRMEQNLIPIFPGACSMDQLSVSENSEMNDLHSYCNVLPEDSVGAYGADWLNHPYYSSHNQYFYDPNTPYSFYDSSQSYVVRYSSPLSEQSTTLSDSFQIDQNVQLSGSTPRTNLVGRLSHSRRQNKKSTRGVASANFFHKNDYQPNIPENHSQRHSYTAYSGYRGRGRPFFNDKRSDNWDRLPAQNKYDNRQFQRRQDGTRNESNFNNERGKNNEAMKENKLKQSKIESDSHVKKNNQHFKSSYGTSKNQSLKTKGVSNSKSGESLFVNDENQRDTLTEQLSSGKYECMICCENIKAEAPVWSCSTCYHVFHLLCIKKWARSSVIKETQHWRCPGCQNVSTHIPYQYRCFCGRRKDPKYVRGEIAHSCSEVCRKGRQGDCKHPCTILCHPGPCPPCCATVWITCNCEKLKKNVRCSKSSKFQCDQVCGKELNCGIHNCTVVCHSGSCQPCQVEKIQECLCKKTSCKVLCGTKDFFQRDYLCEQICGRMLDCGNHTCKEVCHSGDCKTCELLPKNLSTCCCGKTSLSSLGCPERQSCLDPIPTCTSQCNKLLPCGSASEPHFCEKLCHADDCGPCVKVRQLRCQCDSTEKQMPCGVAFTFNEKNPFKCQRRCGRKKTCGRHKCSDNCCVKDFHICEIVCGQKLSCGLHRCEELCHRGNCKRCLQASFEELTCHCGTEVIEPPVPCGTKPPECQKLCTRQHNCQHPVRHTCHSEAVCPPCTELTDKMCAGGHMMRKNVPCHVNSISCGYPCHKMLPCGRHKCQKTCHKGNCLEEGTKCTQPCQRVRTACSHPCDVPCHSNGCPDEPCKAEVTITCACGSKTAKAQCNSGSDMLASIAQFQRLSVQSFAELGNQGLELSQFLQAKTSNKRLDCDSNCALIERNRRLALALEIKNPDLNARLGNPSYTDFLKDYAKKNLKFASDVEKNLNSLVQSAKQSLQSSRSFAFQSMNRDQRRFVHELSEFYGCLTQSYDSEPNKNVVATAQKDKCWLPNVTLTQLVSKGQTVKVPPPLGAQRTQSVNLTVLEKKKVDGSYKGSWEGASTPALKSEQAAPVDYFDYTN
ncbi:Transcriptional repressor NF-X1 [Bulinus truncatus]|nr:Transcriptional repressor NF-X1 [Bulinus truncatus]